MATLSSVLAWRIPDRGAWRATVHGVTKSQTQLKRLSSQGSTETPKREDVGSNTRYPGHCSKQATPRGSSPKEEVGVQEARAQSGPKEKRDGALHTRDPSRPQQDRVQAHLSCCGQHQTPGSRNRGLHLPVLKAGGLRPRWGTGLLPRPWCVDTSSLGSA